jgi:hypothetical protein
VLHADRPLRAVRIDVTTPVLPADDRGMRVDRDERRAKRERRRHQISRKILHIVFSILKIAQRLPATSKDEITVAPQRDYDSRKTTLISRKCFMNTCCRTSDVQQPSHRNMELLPAMAEAATLRAVRILHQPSRANAPPYQRTAS